MLTNYRIKKDYEDFKKIKPIGAKGGPIGEDPNNWEISIPGPPDSPYEGGQFKIKLELKKDYPNIPPECKFLTRVFHPNINFIDGSICVNFLKKENTPDKAHSWTNKKTICDVVIGLYGLLKFPNQDSPLNRNAYDLFNRDRPRYNQVAKCFTNKFAKNN